VGIEAEEWCSPARHQAPAVRRVTLPLHTCACLADKGYDFKGPDRLKLRLLRYQTSVHLDNVSIFKCPPSLYCTRHRAVFRPKKKLKTSCMSSSWHACKDS